MLTPAELASLVSAVKGSVELFDRFGGQIKSVLMPGRRREDEAANDRWRIKIGTDRQDIVVDQSGKRIQTITGEQLASTLQADDLALVRTYESKMQEYFNLWRRVYSEKDSSQDPLVNAKTDEQLIKLVKRMKWELTGILDFLQNIGVHLDDHYMHIRQLIANIDER